MQFSKAQLRRAFDYLNCAARPLERAIATMRFREGSGQQVLEALEPYQNRDGGFGHGLEPDVRTPSSSALATALALNILHETGCSATHSMVGSAVDYFVRTYRHETAVWRAIPPDANDFPHAPWWHDDGKSLSTTFDGFRIIPRALIVSHLHTYADLVPADLLSEATEAAVETLLDVPVLGNGGGSDLEYAVALAGNSALPASHRAKLIPRIERAISEAVVRDRSRWSSYCLHPARAVRRPNGIGSHLVLDDLQRYLDYLIESQQPDGTWPLTWDWGTPDSEAWPIAEREWRGIVALENLEVLQAFARIETA